MFEIIIF